MPARLSPSLRRQGLRLALVCTLSGAVLVPALLIAQLPIPDGRAIDPALRFEVASIKT